MIYDYDAAGHPVRRVSYSQLDPMDYAARVEEIRRSFSDRDAEAAELRKALAATVERAEKAEALNSRAAADACKLRRELVSARDEINNWRNPLWRYRNDANFHAAAKGLFGPELRAVRRDLNDALDACRTSDKMRGVLLAERDAAIRARDEAIDRAEAADRARSHVCDERDAAIERAKHAENIVSVKIQNAQGEADTETARELKRERDDARDLADNRQSTIESQGRELRQKQSEIDTLRREFSGLANTARGFLAESWAVNESTVDMRVWLPLIRGFNAAVNRAKDYLGTPNDAPSVEAAHARSTENARR
jgi:DNA repair exonuclease SbcCD ATPase subunit